MRTEPFAVGGGLSAVVGTTTPATRAPVTDGRIALLLELGRALQKHGAPAPRLESALTALARGLGIDGQLFATPTSVLCAFGPEDDQTVRLLRVEAGEVDLGRLTALDGLLQRLLAGETDVATARAELAALRTAPPWPALGWVLAAHGIACAGAAHFFGGGWLEMGVAGVLGLGIGAAGEHLHHRGGLLERLLAALAALLVAACVTALAVVGLGIAVEPTVLAALIVLVPGFTLTTALAELAEGHLAAGSARLMGAATTLLTLCFGVALGSRLVTGLALGGAALTTATPTPIPLWAALAALVIDPVAFGLLFRARAVDLPWIVGTAIAGYGGAVAGAATLGPEVGAALGALVVGLAGNAQARLRRVPAAVAITPGLMLLVPGSMGYRSLSALLAREVQGGVEAAFTTALVACALVTGLLVAGAVLPPRREL